jgi:hypothetical protein
MCNSDISAADVTGSIASNREERAGSNPSAALHSLRVLPIPTILAKQILVRNHYLHSYPGGTKLCFGVYLDTRLLGALTFGSGPASAYKLVSNAKPEDCMTLTRLWLSDKLPSNSESRILSYAIRSLRKYGICKFLVSYSDPAVGHVGTIYQATGWFYTGLSSAMPLYDFGDGIGRHSRSVSHAYGSHSLKYLNERGVNVKVIPQIPKHRYVYFLDSEWRSRLNVPVLLYPKKEIK